MVGVTQISDQFRYLRTEWGTCIRVSPAQEGNRTDLSSLKTEVGIRVGVGELAKVPLDVNNDSRITIIARKVCLIFVVYDSSMKTK